MKTFLTSSVVLIIVTAASNVHASDKILNKKETSDPSVIKLTHEQVASNDTLIINFSDFKLEENTPTEGEYKDTPKPQLNYDLVDGFDLKLGILSKKKPVLSQRFKKPLK